MKLSYASKNRFSVIRISAMAMLFFVFVTGEKTLACGGPAYPNLILNKVDSAINTMPGGVFEQELKRLGFVSKLKISAVPRKMDGKETIQSYEDQNYEICVSDFKKWLETSSLSSDKRSELLKQYESVRKAIKERQIFSANTKEKGISESENQSPEHPIPALSIDMVSNDFPAEFRDYLKGSICWFLGGKNISDAQRYWQAVLSLPADQRKFRSVWAAYMLARSVEDTNPAEAIKLYRNVRTIAAHGFSDSLGLAAASIGREAMLEYRAKHYDKALHLYLTQYLAGDTEASTSIRIVLSDIIFKVKGYEDSEPLPTDTWASLLKDPVILRLSIAYVVGYVEWGYSSLTMFPNTSMLEQFMTALTKAGYIVKDTKTGEIHPSTVIPEADRMAWIAYRAGKFDLAQDFIAMAKSTDIAHWVQAKLYLRNGETRKALAEYRYLLHTNNTTMFDANSENNIIDAYDDFIPITRLIAGEYGCLLVNREQYIDAIDVFLRNGWWDDAAYIAERILTLDELLDYVRKNFPQAPQKRDNDIEVFYFRYKPQGLMSCIINLRHLLARRLTRIGRWKEAREFYPSDDERKNHKEYIEAIRAGNDTSRSKSQRAADLMKAAKIARLSGMELLGTEIEPDYFIVGGMSGDDISVSPQQAAKTLRKHAGAYKASRDEAARYVQSAAYPNKRFHYRYIAADLAWQAAGLMPNNDPQTAQVLYEAGMWLKDRDPQAADRFYKALVRRCGKTPLGQAADAKRWFPEPPTTQESK